MRTVKAMRRTTGEAHKVTKKHAPNRITSTAKNKERVRWKEEKTKQEEREGEREEGEGDARSEREVNYMDGMRDRGEKRYDERDQTKEKGRETTKRRLRQVKAM